VAGRTPPASRDHPVLGPLTAASDGTWVALVGDVELVIAGGRSGPDAAACEEAARVAPRLAELSRALRDFVVATTCRADGGGPANVPPELREHVAAADAARRWSLEWLEFRAGPGGACRAYFTFEDPRPELLQGVWIVEVRGEVPVSLSRRSW
jgi:hypothetical protein